jgi:hypothetical protein
MADDHMMPAMGGELAWTSYGPGRDEDTIADVGIKRVGEAGLAAMKESGAWPDQCSVIILLAGQTEGALASGAVFSGFEHERQPMSMLLAFMRAMAADAGIPVNIEVISDDAPPDWAAGQPSEAVPSQGGRPSQKWPARVRDLMPGDLVTLGAEQATFIARVPHPLWPMLQLCIWRLAGDWSFDALREDQEIGTVSASSKAQRAQRLRAALAAG